MLLFRFRLLKTAFLLGALACVGVAPAPARAVKRDLQNPYAPAHTWAVFGEYSPSSSHIILGQAREREFVALGVAYTRNMHRGRYWDLSYLFEVRPLMVESDPVLEEVISNYDLPAPYGSGSATYRYMPKLPVLEMTDRELNDSFVENGQHYYVNSQLVYGRRWTYVGGMSPLGLKINFLPHWRLQPTLTANGGFAASLRDVPMFDTSAGNFTFSFGAGVDLFRRIGHPLRLEYRIQHFSNGFVGFNDPGIDSQMLYVGYAWGQGGGARR